jgi:hypothetical protein
MEISDNLIMVILGAIVLFLLYKISCKEGFLVDVFASDFTYSNPINNPFNLLYGQTRRGVPVEDNTTQHPYPGFSGYVNQPPCQQMGSENL